MANNTTGISNDYEVDEIYRVFFQNKRKHDLKNPTNIKIISTPNHMKDNFIDTSASIYIHRNTSNTDIDYYDSDTDSFTIINKSKPSNSLQPSKHYTSNHSPVSIISFSDNESENESSYFEHGSVINRNYNNEQKSRTEYDLNPITPGLFPRMDSESISVSKDFQSLDLKL